MSAYTFMPLFGHFDRATGELKGFSPLGAPGALMAPSIGLTNSAALKPITAALMSAGLQEVVISACGDSLTQLGGDVTAQSSDVLAESSGYLAAMRAEINRRLGLSAYDGGQWIQAQPSVADTRVATSGGASTAPNFAPYVGWRDSSQNIQLRSAGVTLQGAGHTITVTFTGRYITPMQYQNSPGGYNGTYSYTIDGGSAVNVTDAGATDAYRMSTRIDCGTIGAHTVVFTWVSAKVLLAGFLVTNGLGVATVRFGIGGTSAQDWAGRVEREQRTSFKTVPAGLQIIRFSYNDWNRQNTGITPDTYKAALQTLINLALANPATKAVLLMNDPEPSTADTQAYSRAAFDESMKSLAVGQVAYFDTKLALNRSYATGSTYGYYVDFTHNSVAGHRATGTALAAALLDASLLSAA